MVSIVFHSFIVFLQANARHHVQHVVVAVVVHVKVVWMPRRCHHQAIHHWIQTRTVKVARSYFHPINSHRFNRRCCLLWVYHRWAIPWMPVRLNWCIRVLAVPTTMENCASYANQRNEIRHRRHRIVTSAWAIQDKIERQMPPKIWYRVRIVDDRDIQRVCNSRRTW